MEEAAQHQNDNERDSFISLGLATALLLNRIRNSVTLLELAKINEQKGEDTQRDRQRDEPGKSDPEQHREYVDRRLRDLAAFERRFGNKS